MTKDKKIKIPEKLETSEERKFVNAVKVLFTRWKTVKLNLRGNAGWPDQLVLGPNGIMLMIEFKREKGGELSKNQEILHRELQQMNHRVCVAYTAEDALRYIRAYRRIL